MSNQILLCDIGVNDLVIAWYPEFTRWGWSSWGWSSQSWATYRDNSDLIVVGVLRKGLFYTTDQY